VRGKRIQHGGRYDYRAVVLRLERMRVACGVERKVLYEATGIAQSQFSKKLEGRLSTFSLKELGDLADFYTGRTGRSLIGWPLIDAEVSDLLE